MTRLRIAVVGPGKLANSLVPALTQAGHEVVQVLGRDLTKAKAFATAHQIPQSASLDSPVSSDANLIFLTVADQAIAEVAKQLEETGDLGPTAVVVHTSGSTPLSALAPLAPWTGVFYPLMMFTEQREVDLKTVPLFLEGNLAIMARLKPLATQLGKEVHEMSSEDRLRMHMGAVWACNFPNLLFQIAEAQLSKSSRLDFGVYRALLEEQLRQVFELGPASTQTGPAIRGDDTTLQTHLNLLQEQPEWQELYAQLSKLINPSWDPSS